MNFNKLLNGARSFWIYAPSVLGFYRGFNYNEKEPLYTINSLFGIFGGVLYSLPVVKETLFVLYEIPKFEAESRGFKYKGIFETEVPTTK